MVKMVEAELKMEVREDMRAAIITASISPANPAINHILVLYSTVYKYANHMLWTPLSVDKLIHLLGLPQLSAALLCIHFY